MILAALSLAAALIHASVAPEHMAEMIQHGIFMLACVIGQALGALWLPLAARPRWRWVLPATIAGNATILLVALVAYTAGLPAWLPGADGAEAWTWQVVACDLLESLLIIGCFVAWRRVD